MSRELIYEPAPLIAEILDKRDVMVLIIGASREDGEHITDGQKATAMNAAKSVLQMVGADVAVSSTAFLCNATLNEGESLSVTTEVKVYKYTVGSESNENAPASESGANEPTTLEGQTEEPDEAE